MECTNFLMESEGSLFYRVRSFTRNTIVVNLDPANDSLPYECAININDLVTLEVVMQKFGLGPNGGLMYCIEYLEKNIDWLLQKLEPHQSAFSLLLQLIFR